MSKETVKDFILFQIIRKFRNLFRNSLTILENLRDDNKITQAEFYNYRKSILDKGNDYIREVEEDFDKIDIKVKGKR